MELTKAQTRSLKHGKSMSVTAGAGTGKTRILVEKYIGLLEHFPELQISEILALTFTEKAAAEMKSRIRRRLAGMAGSRWQDLQDEFLWARISTFHSFALDILRKTPLHARLPPAFQVVEPTVLGWMFDELFESIINAPLVSLGDWGSSLVSLLKEYGTRKVKSTLYKFYEKRYLVEPFFQALRDSPEKVVEEWQRMSRQFAQEFIDRIPDGIRDHIATLWRLSEKYSSSEDDNKGGQYLSRIKPFLQTFRSSSDVLQQMQALIDIAKDRPKGTLGSKKYFAQDDLERLRNTKRELLRFLTEAKRLSVASPMIHYLVKRYVRF